MCVYVTDIENEREGDWIWREKERGFGEAEKGGERGRKGERGELGACLRPHVEHDVRGMLCASPHSCLEQQPPSLPPALPLLQHPALQLEPAAKGGK